ncbi:MAG: trimethylamine methyltransferase family protein, partial [Pseudomonadota bacterium]
MSDRKSRRAGGRAGNARRDATVAIEQMDWRIITNTDHPTEPLSEEGVEAIHQAAMRVLEEIGIEFLNAEARDELKRAGCDVDPDGTNVKFDRAWIMEKIALVPSQFDITPRNPARKITIGGNHMAFVNVSSPPNAMDLDRGRRVGDFESFTDFLKLTQYFNCIHVAGGY